MRVLAKPAYFRAAKKLSPADLKLVNEAIVRLPDAFGYPHKHAGVGLRRLAKSTYEIRVGLSLRVVFLLEGGDAVLATVGNHDDVRAWLKDNR